MKRFNFTFTLMARVILLVSIGLLLMFGGFAFLSLEAVRESTDRALQERMLLAQITASRVDDLLQQKITSLQTVRDESPFDPNRDNPETLAPILHTFAQHLGDFVQYVAVTDREGNVILSEPLMPELVGANVASNRYAQKVLKTGQPVVSGYFAPEKVESTAAILVSTSKNNGTTNGVIIAAVNLKHPSISHLLGPLGLGKQGYAEIVDEEGFPLASTSEEQSWQNCRYGDRFASLIRDRGTVVGQCHDCHTTSATQKRQNGVMAFAALTTAPWGIVVQQDEREAFAYTKELEHNLSLFGGVAFFITLIVAWLLTRSVVKPVQTLIAASQHIAADDLARPIPRVGGGEVSILGASLDTMRERLKKSLDEIQGWNSELEQRVESRTQELEQAEQSRRELLRKLVVAQEEERRGLARELHDETSQALTALVVGLETATTAPAESVDVMKARLNPIKAMATAMLREIQRIIHDLRPAILDDLGLVQAIDWYAETRLKVHGIQVGFETAGVEKRLPSEVETVVFRLAQEAINNIVRHAGAEAVSISLEFADDAVTLEVEDDGCGFDPATALSPGKGNATFGLLGMKERAALFGGIVSIESKIEEGTKVTAKIPLKGTNGNGKDPSVVGGRSRDVARRTEGTAQSV
ncbi:MAG: HAMP domain-containing protein [Chloroflexi bacterium]|nr:HAMP domain-containing protein [Chloroflexota bacterium]